MINIYGIKNCNTVKKALNWLQENKVDYHFHDFKKEGVSDEKLAAWQQAVSWESLINQRGTTWRKLDSETQASVVDADTARKLMNQHTSVIKRPVIEYAGGILLGFDENEYSQTLLP